MRRALVLGVLALSSACALPDDDKPRLVAAEDAPIDLSPPPSTPPEGTSGDESVNVFFIDTETQKLDVRVRRVEVETPQAGIEALLEGLLPGEQDALDTAIPEDTQLRAAPVLDGSVLVVDLTPPLPGGIQSVLGTTQLQAFAQIVQTVTAFSGVQSVRFLVEGEAIPVPTDNGPVTEPVTRDDYTSLAPTEE
jgi:spore germination protein GerM